MVTIAPATHDDISGVQDAVRASWRATYRDIFTPEFMDDFITTNYTAERLATSIDSSDDVFLVARDGERVIGFTHAGTRGGETTMYRLYLVPEYWRSGTGTRLLNTLEAALRERGITSYHCFVHSRNEIGKAFYLRSGFTRRPDRDLVDDDEWCMVRALP